MSFTISDVRIKPENNVTKMLYSEMEEYYTHDSESGDYTWESEYKIINKNSKIPLGSLEDWLNSVMEYINGYNDRLPEQTVTFEISAVRSNAMYNYKKYINGIPVSEGWADYGMIDEKETKIWADEVVNFRKKNGLPLPTDETIKALEKTKEERNNPNSPFGRDTSGTIPNIPAAIRTLQINPCEFPAKLTEAVKIGPTGPIDQLKGMIQGKKQEICQNISMSSDDFNANVGPVLDPVLETIEEKTSNISNEEESSYDYYMKKFAREREIINDVMTSQSQSSGIVQDGMPDGMDMESDALIISGDGSYSIPAWMESNIKAAMNGRYKHNKGVPSKTIVDRYNSYKSYFFSTFQKQGVPVQLTVLSIIESGVGLVGDKENSATAKGMWQIIRSTAAAYGLLKRYSTGAIVPGTDKRNDYTASTPVAAKLLKNIRTGRKFNNWIYVAAGYNWGGGNVSKALSKAGKGADIWTVWKRFPLETRNYVCLLIGLCRYFGMSIDPLFS